MPIINLTTEINAPIETCFDLARSVDLHKASMYRTGESVIAGRTNGLIELNETITWRGKHFGFWQSLTARVTHLEHPFLFVDEMVSGAFQRFRHEHRFKQVDKKTIMADIFDFDAPFGIFGKLAEQFFLRRYMTNLLLQRSAMIKEAAEAEQLSALSA